MTPEDPLPTTRTEYRLLEACRNLAPHIQKDVRGRVYVPENKAALLELVKRLTEDVERERKHPFRPTLGSSPDAVRA